MLRHPALGSAGTLVLCSALSAVPSSIRAQTADRTLPPVTIEAPARRQAVPQVKKPSQRIAAASRSRKKPAATASAKPPPVVDSDPSGRALDCDLIVIGGGVNGVGVARDASLRGVGTAHGDAWQAVRMVLGGLGGEDGLPHL